MSNFSWQQLFLCSASKPSTPSVFLIYERPQSLNADEVKPNKVDTHTHNKIRKGHFSPKAPNPEILNSQSRLSAKLLNPSESLEKSADPREARMPQGPQPEVLNDFYEFRFEPVSIPLDAKGFLLTSGHRALGFGLGNIRLRPSNLVDDLRKLINNPAFADAVCPASPEFCDSAGAFDVHQS